MNKEEEVMLEVAENWRKSARMAIIKFFVWLFLGCSAVVIGLHFIAKYINEHNPKPSVYSNKQTYNGHDYLFLSTGNQGEEGVVHDPDCACHKSAEKRQSKPQKTEGERFLIMPTVKETSKGVVSSISTR